MLPLLRRHIAAIGFIVTLGVGTMGSTAAYFTDDISLGFRFTTAADFPSEEPELVWICKLVGKPDAPRMRAENNPMLVAGSAITEGKFADEHGSPVVLEGTDCAVLWSLLTGASSEARPTGATGDGPGEVSNRAADATDPREHTTAKSDVTAGGDDRGGDENGVGDEAKAHEQADADLDVDGRDPTKPSAVVEDEEAMGISEGISEGDETAGVIEEGADVIDQGGDLIDQGGDVIEPGAEVIDHGTGDPSDTNGPSNNGVESEGQDDGPGTRDGEAGLLHPDAATEMSRAS